MFASRQLSVVEKRKLMRFLTSCIEQTEEQSGEILNIYHLMSGCASLIEFFAATFLLCSEPCGLYGGATFR